MPKEIPLPTRALGTESVNPDLSSLAGWISKHRGTKADLMAYRFDASLSPELAAGISFPCAGGLFYHERIRECLTGLNARENTATGEIHVDGNALVEDSILATAQKKEVWCALPSPHTLGITDKYYNDDEEWSQAITVAYRIIMRTMRDAGIGGHVLIGNTLDEREISVLAGKKVFFFSPSPGEEDLELLMEYQRQVAISTRMLDMAFDLATGYEINRWILLDPDEEGIRRILSHVDTDQVIAGGYCIGESDTYWKNLIDCAVYMK
ncbi:MAG: hypothetical protein WCE65_04335 [Methanoregula sp.]